VPLGAIGPPISIVFDRASVIWSLRRFEDGCGSVGFMKEVQPGLLGRPALGPLSSTSDHALVGR
jgi:hypothetical protein